MPNGTSAPGNVSPAYVLSSGFCPAFAPTNGLTNPARSRPPPCSVSAGAARAGAIAIAGPARSATDNEACRPDGLYRTPGPDVPSCQVYDTAGREKMSTPRRVIGYFTGWRTGKDGAPAYLAKDIPWSNLT